MTTIFRVNDENGNLIGARNSRRTYTHALVAPVVVQQTVPPAPGSKFTYAYKSVAVPGHYEVVAYYGSAALAARAPNHYRWAQALEAGIQPRVLPVEVGTPADLRATTAKRKAASKALLATHEGLTHYKPPGA